MSGFMQQLLARASGQVTGPQVRLQSASTWAAQAGSPQDAAPAQWPAVADSVTDVTDSPSHRAGTPEDMPDTTGFRRRPGTTPGERAAVAPAAPARRRSALDEATLVQAPDSGHSAMDATAAQRRQASDAGMARRDDLQEIPRGDTRRPAQIASRPGSPQADVHPAARPVPLLPAIAPVPVIVPGTDAQRQGSRRHGTSGGADELSAAADQVVHVSIGRIDVIAQSPAPAARGRSPTRPASTLPLADYLRGAPRERR